MFAPSPTAMQPFLDQRLSVLAIEFVLRRRGHRNLARNIPDIAAGNIFCILMISRVFGDPAPFDFLEFLDQVEIDPFLMDDNAIRVGAGDDLRAKLVQLLDRVNRDMLNPRQRRFYLRLNPCGP